MNAVALIIAEPSATATAPTGISIFPETGQLSIRKRNMCAKFEEAQSGGSKVIDLWKKNSNSRKNNRNGKSATAGGTTGIFKKFPTEYLIMKDDQCACKIWML